MEVYDVKFYEDSVVFLWQDPECGFGEFEIYKDDKGVIHGLSEAMCNNNDKSFLIEVLTAFAKEVNIDE